MNLDFELVTKDNLVATLPSWGEYFEVSMQIWVESFSGQSDGWSELIRFTATEKDCCSAGDRIPAIFVNSSKFKFGQRLKLNSTPKMLK